MTRGCRSSVSPPTRCRAASSTPGTPSPSRCSVSFYDDIFCKFSAQVDSEDSHLVNVTGGSLGYNYQVTTLVLHWGEGEEGGSEHSVGGRHAALEIQVTIDGMYYGS